MMFLKLKVNQKKEKENKRQDKTEWRSGYTTTLRIKRGEKTTRTKAI